MPRDHLTPAQGTKGHSFCETIYASGIAPWHIRKLTATGPKYSGGADSQTLCGKTMEFGGWDLDVPMSEHHLAHACKVCVAKLKGKPMNEWKPIETAPKDRRILLRLDVFEFAGGQWKDDRYALKKPRPYWTSDVERLMGKRWMRDHQPTHWMDPSELKS